MELDPPHYTSVLKEEDKSETDEPEIESLMLTLTNIRRIKER